MEKVLSKLARKPSGIEVEQLKRSGWYDSRERVFNHMENDRVLQKLIGKFEMVDDQLKLTKSTADMKISFQVLISSRGQRYMYARTQFLVNGKRKDFKKYLGKEEEIDLEKIDLSFLRKYFLNMLKNYLEYQY